MFFTQKKFTSQLMPEMHLSDGCGFVYLFANASKMAIIVEGCEDARTFYLAHVADIEQKPAAHSPSLTIKVTIDEQLENIKKHIAGLECRYSEVMTLARILEVKKILKIMPEFSALKHQSRTSYLKHLFEDHEDSFSKALCQDLQEKATSSKPSACHLL